MKGSVINLRARPEQRALIDHAAELLGRSRSDFMLDAACARAQDVLLDRTLFTLESVAFAQFAQLLDNAPAVNPGLERLRSIVPPWSAQGDGAA